MHYLASKTHISHSLFWGNVGQRRLFVAVRGANPFGDSIGFVVPYRISTNTASCKMSTNAVGNTRIAATKSFPVVATNSFFTRGTPSALQQHQQVSNLNQKRGNRNQWNLNHTDARTYDLMFQQVTKLQSGLLDAAEATQFRAQFALEDVPDQRRTSRRPWL